MKIFGLAGWSGSGKTTLLTRLIPMLTARGLAVSTVKHAHHAFDLDQPGKDSYLHREAGAVEVLITSQRRWALMHENRGAPEPALEDLLPRLSAVDLVLIEGFKNHAHRKLEIFRHSVGKPLLCLNDPYIIAIASDGPVPEAAIPVIDLDDIPAIADFVIESCGLTPPAEAPRDPDPPGG